MHRVSLEQLKLNHLIIHDKDPKCHPRIWRSSPDQTVPMREKLLALKLIIQSDETRFKLLSEGPGLLAIKSLEVLNGIYDKEALTSAINEFVDHWNEKHVGKKRAR